MITSENIFIRINGNRFGIDELPGLDLTVTETCRGNVVMLFEFQLKNRGSEPVKVDAVELRFDNDSFFGEKADSYRFYKEGLTVVGVSGARGKGDCDFELDPNFLRFTVSDKDGYSWKQKDIFCSEQVGVVSNKHSNTSILLGFVTAKNYFCRIIMNMERDTDIHLTAVIDTDGFIIAPGNEIHLEKLMINSGDDVEKLLETYVTETASQMQAIPSRDIPNGWCSYYYYYGQETEDDILENSRFLAENRDTIPVDYIQIDDGWQKARGSWLETNPRKFPHGMKWLAEEIKALGLKPGIWVAPFLVSGQAEVYQEHKDWLLRDADGNLLMMGGDYFLDTSHPEALKWLTECFKVMKGWGYTYFKLDFMMVETCYNARYYDKNITRVQAYRQGLAVIRKAIGDDAFILGGTALITPDVGLINGSRVTTDVTPFWSLKGCTPESPTIFNICRNMINRGYMHQKLWTNDPDCLIVREQHNREKYKDIPPLSLQETFMLASAMIMSGGALFLGDRMQELSEERLEIINKVFAMRNGIAAYPLDRMEREIPQIWFRKGTGSPDNPHLLAVFNWGDHSAENRVYLKDLNLRVQDKYSVDDVWMDKKSQYGADPFMEVTLEPHTCKLLNIYRD